MFRVDTTTAVATLPATKPAGTQGYFTEGNPSSGLLATVPGVDWFNMTQEELMAVVLAAGLTPSKTDNTQLLQAIILLAIPPGRIDMYGGATPPSGYLLCNGAAVSRTTYAALFAKISTTWGVGDGSTTFNVPDFRGRAPIGAGQGTGLTNRALGATLGEEAHALTTAEMPAHTHPIVPDSTPFKADGTIATGTNGWSTQASGGTTVTGSTGSGTAHNTMQPSAAVNFIIKT